MGPPPPRPTTDIVSGLDPLINKKIVKEQNQSIGILSPDGNPTSEPLKTKDEPLKTKKVPGDANRIFARYAIASAVAIPIAIFIFVMNHSEENIHIYKKATDPEYNVISLWTKDKTFEMRRNLGEFESGEYELNGENLLLHINKTSGYGSDGYLLIGITRQLNFSDGNIYWDNELWKRYYSPTSWPKGRYLIPAILFFVIARYRKKQMINQHK